MSKRQIFLGILTVALITWTFVSPKEESHSFWNDIEIKKKSSAPVERPGYDRVFWDLLTSFKYATSEHEIEMVGGRYDTIPPEVLALEGKKVLMDGFMIPLSVPDEDYNVTDFVLVRDRMSCCFGDIPEISHWVLVSMAGENKAPYSGILQISVYGTFEVGEEEDEAGARSLYRMKGDAVDIVEDEDGFPLLLNSL